MDDQAAGDDSLNIGSNTETHLLKLREERSALVISRHIWSNTRKQFREIFGQVASDVIMYQLWRVYGSSMVKEFIPKNQREEGLETLRRLLLAFAETNGWNNVSAEIKEAKNEISLDLSNCQFCEKSNSDKPACFEVSGLLAGFSEEITGKRCTVTEIRCIAKGNDACSFLIKIG